MRVRENRREAWKARSRSCRLSMVQEFIPSRRYGYSGKTLEIRRNSQIHDDQSWSRMHMSIQQAQRPNDEAPTAVEARRPDAAGRRRPASSGSGPWPRAGRRPDRIGWRARRCTGGSSRSSAPAQLGQARARSTSPTVLSGLLTQKETPGAEAKNTAVAYGLLGPRSAGRWAWPAAWRAVAPAPGWPRPRRRRGRAGRPGRACRRR